MPGLALFSAKILILLQQIKVFTFTLKEQHQVLEVLTQN
jgi:hypothetical protein